MKRLLLVLALTAGVVWAQEPANQMSEPPASQPQQAPKTPPKFTSNLVERPQAPTYSDINCAGFVTREPISAANIVIGGKESPHAARFGSRDIVFLQGENLSVDQQFRIVRRVANRNRVMAFPEQAQLEKSRGDQWADLGYLHVTAVKDGVGIATIDFACDAVVAGDIIVPFVERPALTFSRGATQLNQFDVPQATAKGRIIQSKDFDYVLGTGKKIYIDLGSDKGLKPGDYLRITKGYDPAVDMTPVDRLSAKAMDYEESSEKMPKPNKDIQKKFPRRNIGEIMILAVQKDSATAMITTSIEEIFVGDQVEYVAQ